MGRPRWLLQLQASFFRSLMSIGMFLHRRASPTPPSPNFTRTFDTTISTYKGRVKLHFYTPKGYCAHRKSKKDRSRHGNRQLYPVVVNFHGGGFTLGHATDDCRWASYVMSRVGAVVVSVDYRLAPKYAFPTAVEDGADAIMWLSAHATDLDLDIDRMAISGFSSGGNMCFTVPLRLQESLLYRAVTNGTTQTDDCEGIEVIESEVAQASTNTTNTSPTDSSVSISLKDRTKVSVLPKPELNIRGVVSFYPPVDYTQTRAQRRATCVRADQQLPALFTDLFDDSYLSPPTLNLANPYLSPSRATDDMLSALPEEIVILTAEWDMLVKEAEEFRDRLGGKPSEAEEGKLGGLGKKVKYWCVPGVPHGWDKAPNPLRETPGTAEWYGQACDELKRILE